MWIGTTTVSRFRRRASSGDSPQTIFFRRLRPRLLGHKVGHFDIEFGPKRTRARRARDTTMGIASRCRRCCAAVETVGDAFLRSVGPCYVLLGFGLVFTVAYSLLCVVLPLTRDLRTWQGFGTFAAVAFVFGNIGFNYVMSVRTDPGSPTQRDVQVMCAEAGAAVRRWCDKCRCPKPDLTHHCSVCKLSLIHI